MTYFRHVLAACRRPLSEWTGDEATLDRIHRALGVNSLRGGYKVATGANITSAIDIDRITINTNTMDIGRISKRSSAIDIGRISKPNSAIDIPRTSMTY
jgi:hypothetical protein